MNKYLKEDSPWMKGFVLLGSVALTISAIATVIMMYPNIRTPKVTVKDVDYEKGFAKLTIDGKDAELIGDSTMGAGGDWGVKFGTGPSNDNQMADEYETIELIQHGMVKKILAKKEIV